MTFILLILFGVLFLLFLLMHDEARMERERSQLHAEGDPLSCPGRKQTRTRTQRHLTTPPVTGAASPPRDDFDADHSNRPRLGR